MTAQTIVVGTTVGLIGVCAVFEGAASVGASMGVPRVAAGVVDGRTEAGCDARPDVIFAETANLPGRFITACADNVIVTPARSAAPIVHSGMDRRPPKY